jgi:hypothetical protein
MSLNTIEKIRRKIIEIQGFIGAETSNGGFDEIYDRFKGFFNGRGNDYLGALAYFNCLRDKEKEELRKHPIHGPNLELAIDQVMWGNYGNCATN